MKVGPNVLTVYAGVLFASGIALLGWMTVQSGFGDFPFLAMAGYIVFTVFIISSGFAGPYIGHTSLDRLAQIAAVLIFGTLVAGWINAIAAFIWPFIDREHSKGNMSRKLMRAMHGCGMFTIMILISGTLYEKLGGQVPLQVLSTGNILAIVVMVLVMQATNELMMLVFAWLDEQDFMKSLSLFASLVEIAGATLGVFTAIIFNVMEPPVYWLYLVVLVVIVLVVKRYAENHWSLAERVDELVSINRIGRAVSSSLILDDLVELIYQESRKLFRFSAFYLVLYNENKQELDFRLHHNEQGRQPRKFKPLGEGAISWVVQKNQSVLIKDWEKSDHEARHRAVIVGEPPASMIGVPVTFGNRILGVISIQNFVPNTFDEDHLKMMQTFADQVAVAIANARLFGEVEEYRMQLEQRVDERTSELSSQKEELFQLSQSLRFTNRQKEELLEELQRKTEELDKQTKEDSLTKLFNRRYMESRLENELQRAERYKRPITVAILDIDDFKLINDNFSHMLADEVLRRLADLLRQQCRAIDVIARLGGDEFVLCFPETDLENARIICEKVRKAIEGYTWRDLDAKLFVTVSIGVAAAAPHYHQDKTMMAADAKMYEAKRAGRNQVMP
ncbi:MAG: diguanylate cyclase [Gammaproteobacteria bacterium]